MYTGSVFRNDDSMPGYDTLIALWKLGDRLGIHGLCEKTLVSMQECRRITQHIPATPLLVQVWQDTIEGSAIRKLLLQWAAEYVRSSESREEFTKSLPHNVLSDLVVAMSHLDYSTPAEHGEPSLSSESQARPKNIPPQDPHDDEDAPRRKIPKHGQPDNHITNGQIASADRKSGGRKAQSRSSLSGHVKAGKKQRMSINVSAIDRQFTEEERLTFCADLIGRMLSGPGK